MRTFEPVTGITLRLFWFPYLRSCNTHDALACHCSRVVSAQVLRSMAPSPLPWWRGPDETEPAFNSSIERMRAELHEDPSLISFKQNSIADFVVGANVLEGTLPQAFDNPATKAKIQQVLQQEINLAFEFRSPPERHTWAAEGGGSSIETQQQLLQYAKAAQYCCNCAHLPLTTDMIRTMHKLAMYGAVEEEDGSMVQPGEFRTTSCHSGTGFVYPDALTIPTELETIVARFNRNLEGGSATSYSLAGELLYRVVTVHPFQNGNGRTCRLLAAYAGLAAGDPFLLHLDNGRKKTRQHYHQVLKHADKHHDAVRLELFILECQHKQWRSAMGHAGKSLVGMG
jgi:fido (protein-threonine AMPylation protein)